MSTICGVVGGVECVCVCMFGNVGHDDLDAIWHDADRRSVPYLRVYKIAFFMLGCARLDGAIFAARLD